MSNLLKTAKAQHKFNTVYKHIILHSSSPQGQVSLRQALTVATTGGCDYMKRCHNKMRSELPKYDGYYSENLSFTFILLDRSIAVIEMQKSRHNQ